MNTATEVKERPILFSTDMVQAILDGRKTQARRVIKPQPEKENGLWRYAGAGWSRDDFVPVMPRHSLESACPYGKPGDLLYVREAFCRYAHGDPESPTGIRTNKIAYRADDPYLDESWKPSIHMPKDIARIWLEVKDIRVERVQEIKPHEIIKEGIHPVSLHDLDVDAENDKWDEFIRLWDSINAKRGYGWEENPWVWVVEFKVKEVES